MNSNYEVPMQTACDEGTEIKDIIIRATQDESFRNHLFENADEAMKDFNLTEVQKILIKSLRKEDFEKLTPENMQEFFAADSAVYTPDMEMDVEILEATEEDI